MLKSDLLTAILNDYVQQGDAEKQHEDVLQAFCEYATGWLIEKGLVGVGHSVSGVSFRFTDGQELSVIDVGTSQPTAPAMSITGSAAAPARPGVTTAIDSSFAITGK
jgi:hypothetical protein